LPTVSWTYTGAFNPSSPELLDKYGSTGPAPGASKILGVFDHNVEAARRIEQRTNGKFTIEMYSVGQLYGSKEGVEACSSGAVEMCGTMGTVIAGMNPTGYAIFGIPYAFKGYLDYADWLESPAGAQWLDIARRGYAKSDLYYLSPGPGSASTWFTKFPVHKLEDLEGKKLRGSGLWGKIAGLLGAVAVNIPYAEQGMALQRGILDGTCASGEYVKKAGVLDAGAIYGLLPYITNPQTMDTVVNLDAWNSLPEEYQKILFEEWWDQNLWHYRVCYPYAQEVATKEAIELYGAEFITLPEEELEKFKEAVLPLYDEVAAMSPENAEIIDLYKEHAGLK